MRKKGTIWIFMGILLILAALCLVGYNFVIQRMAEKQTGLLLDDLKKKVPELSIDVTEYPDYILNPDMEMPVIETDGEMFVGVLTILALELELPVLSEWSYSNLRKAPCRYSGTAYKGNFVICAHNYSSHFGNLHYLSGGDRLQFTDAEGNVFTYEVVETETLQSAAVEEMKSEDCDLTLFTCNVNGTERQTIRCKKVEI